MNSLLEAHQRMLSQARDSGRLRRVDLSMSPDEVKQANRMKALADVAQSDRVKMRRAGTVAAKRYDSMVKEGKV